MTLTVKELTDQMWSSNNFLASVKPDDGKYLSAACVFRGPLATEEVDSQISRVQSEYMNDFVTWIPNNIKTSIINVSQRDVQMSSTFIANTTAIKGVFQRISIDFGKMYKRRAFLHW